LIHKDKLFNLVYDTVGLVFGLLGFVEGSMYGLYLLLTMPLLFISTPWHNASLYAYLPNALEAISSFVF